MPSKPFDTALAEAGQQSTLDSLRRNFQYDAAKSAYESGGDLGRFGISGLGGSSSSSLSGGGTSGGGGNFEDTVRRALSMSQEAIKPAVESFQQAIPETQQAFGQEKSRLEAQKNPLRARYDNLIAQIRGQSQQAEQSQTLVTNNELGRRGILGSSGAAQQEIQNVVAPIRERGQQAITDATLAGEGAISNIDNLISQLTGQETGAVRDIRNAIGQLQAGQVPTAISSALSQLQLGQSANQFSQQQQLAQQQLQEQMRQFNTGNQPQPLNALQQAQARLLNAQAGQLGQQPQQLGQTNTSSGFQGLMDLWNQL